MREKTQANLRNQGVAIAEVRGALQILAQTNLVGKENIQARIKHWEAKLTDIQNKLTEIEFSEPIITLPKVKLTEEEIRKLTDSDEVSFRNYNPPHPYMYEPVTTQGKITGRKSNSHESLVQVDVKDPKFPDIPEALDNNTTSTGKPATGGNMP